jgi:hypothetical protein
MRGGIDDGEGGTASDGAGGVMSESIGLLPQVRWALTQRIVSGHIDIRNIK